MNLKKIYKEKMKHTKGIVKNSQNQYPQMTLLINIALNRALWFTKYKLIEVIPLRRYYAPDFIFVRQLLFERHFVY